MNADPRTLNLYTYAEGNPIMNIDPDGHWAQVAIGAAIGGAFSLGSYLLTTPKSQWNIRDAAINLGAGSIGGALITVPSMAVLAGAASGAAWYIATTSEKNYSHKGYAKSVAVGAITGGIGTGIANKISKAVTIKSSVKSSAGKSTSKSTIKSDSKSARKSRSTTTSAPKSKPTSKPASKLTTRKKR